MQINETDWESLVPDFGLVFCFIGLHYRRTCVNRGSKASRSASPRRLKLIKAKKMKSPGKKTCSGAMKMLVAALVNRFPQLGVGGWMPSPRKLSVVSARMAAPASRVAATMSGAREFGNK